MTLMVAALATPAAAGESPKPGGILTYVIPADAPPSFDAHREGTFATVHSAAPFCSVLIRIDPDNPSSTTDFVCDLCTEMPQPTNGGKTYTFKIRNDKQAVRVAALRSDRAAIEFRGLPLSVRDELVGALGDKIAVQTSDWNCGQMVTPNHRHKPFDDARVRRASTLAIDRWHGAPELARIANVRTVGGIVFPGSPLAADKEELQDIAGYWPDIEKSRTEARRLLREAGAEGLSFELVKRNVDQPYKYDATWVIDRWSKIGLHVTQRVLPPVPGSKRCGTATSTRSCTATATVWSTRCSMCNGTCRPRSTSRAPAGSTTNRRAIYTTGCCVKLTSRGNGP